VGWSLLRLDGVFEPVEEATDGLQSVRCRAATDLTPEAVAAITEQVRIGMLRWFARSGLIDHLAAQLASGLAAAQAASASLPRRARPQLAPAGGGRRPGA
jgi:hypothetical protein